MNPRLVEIYRSVRPKEALKSQDIYESANVLLGSEVEKFAELIVRECAKALDDKLANPNGASMAYCDGSDLLEHFGVEE